MDWSKCPDVESVPGKMWGAWVVKGTRVPADALVTNARFGYSPEALVEGLFPSVPLDAVCGVLMFARLHEPSGGQD